MWDLLLPQKPCKRTQLGWWSSAGPATALCISKQPTAHCQQQLPSDHNFICSKPLEVSKACYTVQTQQQDTGQSLAPLEGDYSEQGAVPCSHSTQTQHPSPALGNEGWSLTATEEGLVQATNAQFNTSPKYPKRVCCSSPTNDAKIPVSEACRSDPCQGKGKALPPWSMQGQISEKNLCPFPGHICFLLPVEKPKSWRAEPRAAEAAKLFHSSDDQQWKHIVKIQGENASGDKVGHSNTIFATTKMLKDTVVATTEEAKRYFKCFFL